MAGMGRWEPNSVERLQQAAGELFQERGYDDVTVAEIADRAGLTKRTFFNHFADKREVLFAGARTLQAGAVQYLADTAADGDIDPLDAAVAALTRGGLDLAHYGESALARRELIASSLDLQERDLVKRASLAAAIADALRTRRIPERIAAFAAQAAVAVFASAYDDWAEDPSVDFSALMQRSLSDLRHAVGGEAPPRTGTL
jgi:AcrR family transcriptional regulator